jgi:hypothetical protein
MNWDLHIINQTPIFDKFSDTTIQDSVLIPKNTIGKIINHVNPLHIIVIYVSNIIFKVMFQLPSLPPTPGPSSVGFPVSYLSCVRVYIYIYIYIYLYIFTHVHIHFFTAQKPLVGQSLLIFEASRSHLVGLLWMSDQPEAETPTWQHTTLTRDRYRCQRWDSNIRTQKVNARNPRP